MARVRMDRAYLSASFATAHTINSNVEGTYYELTFHNTDTVNREVSVREVPQGVSAGVQHTVMEWKGSNVLRPNETRSFRARPNLQTGDQISWKSDVANKVTAGGFVNEEGT